jgi:hypothetical protein
MGDASSDSTLDWSGGGGEKTVAEERGDGGGWGGARWWQGAATSLDSRLMGVATTEPSDQC